MRRFSWTLPGRETKQRASMNPNGACLWAARGAGAGTSTHACRKGARVSARFRSGGDRFAYRVGYSKEPHCSIHPKPWFVGAVQEANPKRPEQIRNTISGVNAFFTNEAGDALTDLR